MRVRELAATRIPPWPGPWLRLATLLPLLLVIVEGVNVTPHPTVPTQPAALRTTSRARCWSCRAPPASTSW